MPPQFSFRQMLSAVLCQFSGRRVSQRVAVAVGKHIVWVDIMVSPYVTDPTLLYYLAVLSLCHSPALKSLPPWIDREIKRRARRIHLISPELTCDEVAVASLADIAGQEDLQHLASLVASVTIEQVSANRVTVFHRRTTELVTRLITLQDLVPVVPLQVAFSCND